MNKIENEPFHIIRAIHKKDRWKALNEETKKILKICVEDMDEI